MIKVAVKKVFKVLRNMGLSSGYLASLGYWISIYPTWG